MHLLKKGYGNFETAAAALSTYREIPPHNCPTAMGQL